MKNYPPKQKKNEKMTTKKKRRHISKNIQYKKKEK